MGGEPTFVSIDDYQSAEWNTAALGPTKRSHADELIRRLARLALRPGGLLHYGQGKWYPGEPLPRWAFALFWRRDGKPMWRNAALIATETGAASAARRRRATLRAGVAARLGLGADYVQPAFEDPAERMLREGELPREHRSRATPRSTIPVERARIMRAFERHLSQRRPATCCRCSAGAGAGGIRLDQRDMAGCAAAPVPRCRAIPRSAFACRSARCPMSMPADYPAPGAGGSRSPSVDALPRIAASAVRLRQGGEFRRASGCCARGRVAARAFRSAPRSRSSRAMAGFACSCRRSNGWRTISSCSPSSKRPPPSSTCRSMWRATSRRPIRA